MMPEHTKRSRQIERLRDLRNRQAQEIERLCRENERLREQLTEQAQRIADLEPKLALREQNSTITSKPPLSAGLAAINVCAGDGTRVVAAHVGSPAIRGTLVRWCPRSGWTTSLIMSASPRRARRLRRSGAGRRRPRERPSRGRGQCPSRWSRRLS
jgi:hypothetical protein